MHLNSALLFEKYAVPYFKKNTKVLEIGPAGHPSAYQKAVNDSNIIWHTIDFPKSVFIEGAVNNLTYTLSSPYVFPVEDDFYDIVVSGQVIEHVQNIFTWLKEIKRVVKKGGFAITINPISWPYHEAPVDCWRIFPDGIKTLAEETELTVIECFFESLEAEDIKKIDPGATIIPGRSYSYIQKPQILNKKMRWNKIIRKIPSLGKFQIPIEVAFDTISILQKP